MTHPFLETERCGDCARWSRRYEDDDACDSCNGKGRRYALTRSRISNGESLRIYDLLLQKDAQGCLRARFDCWASSRWQSINTDRQLATILDQVRAN